MEEKVILRYIKHLDSKNRFLIPEVVVKDMGRDYYLEYYKDKLILIPIKKEEKK